MIASRKFSDEEILNIYNNEYIGKHIGGTTLSKKYGVDFYKDFKRLNLDVRGNHEKGKKYTCNSDFFKNIDSEEKAYWLGFVYGDGYITKKESYLVFGLSLNSDDKRHIEKFCKAIETNIPIHTYVVSSSGYKVGTKYSRIVITDETFANNLISHGCVERKSNIMKPPTGLPNKYVKHFIRGIMDANGSITITHDGEIDATYQINFTGTKSLLMWIQEYLYNASIIDKIYKTRKRKKEHIVTSFSFGGNYKVKKFLDYIYSDATVWLDRKYDRYLKLCDLLNKREQNKRINVCAYCGTTSSGEFDRWTHGGEYNNKILCRKHYIQLRKYGKIIPDKKDYCDICGGTTGLHRLGFSWGDEWHGKTVCEKHYYQLSYHHEITDATAERNGYTKNEI